MSRRRRLIVLAKLAAALAVLAVSALLLILAVQRRLIYPAPRTQPPAIAAGFEAVSLATADGLKLVAWHARAQNGRPTLIFFHGNGDSLLGAVAATRSLVAAGYGVLLPEYRGYGGNPGSPSETGLYDDARAAAGFLNARGVADGAIVAIGNSLGSGPATQLAAERSLAGLVVVSGFASLGSVAAQAFGLPIGFLVRDRYDNAAKVARLATPVLILHGDADRVVAVSHGRTLGQGGGNIAYREFAGVGHDLAYRPEAQAATLDWLDRQGQRAPAKALR